MTDGQVVTSGLQARRRHRAALALVVIGSSVAGGVPLLWAAMRPARDVGLVTVDAPVLTQASPGSVVTTATAGVLAIAEHSARLADQRMAPSGPLPIRVRVPSIAVNARVVPVGIDDVSNGVQVPPDVRIVGWYRFGPAPGGDGSTVLVGHVDSAEQGPGAFFHLGALAPGTLVQVRLSDGSTVSYSVAARRRYPKGRLPSSLFEQAGTPRLVLITCGGGFDPATHHYQDNVVVVAVPRG